MNRRKMMLRILTVIFVLLSITRIVEADTHDQHTYSQQTNQTTEALTVDIGEIERTVTWTDASHPNTVQLKINC